MIEVFFGSAFALFVDSLFSKPQAAAGGADDDITKPQLDGNKDQPLLGGVAG